MSGERCEGRYVGVGVMWKSVGRSWRRCGGRYGGVFENVGQV